MALPEKTGSVPDPDQDGTDALSQSASLFANSLTDPLAFSAMPTTPGRRPLAIGVVISIVINLGLLYSWGYFYLPTLSEKPETLNRTLQVRLQTPSQPVKPIPLYEPSKMEPAPVAPTQVDTPATAEPIAELRDESKDEPMVTSPATLLQEPEAAQSSAEANLAKLLAERTILLPADADLTDYALDTPPSSGAFDNVFDPELRRQLRMREAETNQSLDTVNLNRSTAADPDQRVALGEKCFRLEDTSGGRMSQKIWYRAKCRDLNDESETMKRAIQSGLRR